MPTWNRVFQVPGVSAQEAHDRAKKEISELLEESNLGEFEIEHDVGLRRIDFKSKHATATFSFTDGQISVAAKLSLPAFAFRGKIEQALQNWIDQWNR